uniref:Uncharacterized protein n=1 Tax=Aplanochytrium stocchinoi TaxID=215587 RepID=A0A7S3PJQ4_9STRA
MADEKLRFDVGPGYTVYEHPYTDSALSSNYIPKVLNFPAIVRPNKSPTGDFVESLKSELHDAHTVIKEQKGLLLYSKQISQISTKRICDNEVQISGMKESIRQLDEAVSALQNIAEVVAVERIAKRHTQDSKGYRDIELKTVTKNIGKQRSDDISRQAVENRLNENSPGCNNSSDHFSRIKHKYSNTKRGYAHAFTQRRKAEQQDFRKTNRSSIKYQAKKNPEKSRNGSWKYINKKTAKVENTDPLEDTMPELWLLQAEKALSFVE